MQLKTPYRDGAIFSLQKSIENYRKKCFLFVSFIRSVIVIFVSTLYIFFPRARIV